MKNTGIACTGSTCSKVAMSCERCSINLCRIHMKSGIHRCSAETAWYLLDRENPPSSYANPEQLLKELEKAHGKINEEALRQRASELNKGLSCVLDEEDPLGIQLAGNTHFHRRIFFEDGSTWLLRFVGRATSNPELDDAVLVSESATLKWLENVEMPTPKLYDFALETDRDNKIGVSYMLTSELPGEQLHDPSRLTAQQSRKFFKSYAGVLAKLGKHGVDRIGSLTFDKNGKIEIGPIIKEPFTSVLRIGPFKDATAYYTTWAKTNMDHIVRGYSYERNPVDAYLFFKYVDGLASEGKLNDFAPELDNGPFYLKHKYDKGDHILVDQDFNITGITTWSSAQFVPAYEAFGPSILTATMSQIYSGELGATKADQYVAQSLQKQRSDLAQYAAAPDKIRRLLFALGDRIDVYGVKDEELLSMLRGAIASTIGCQLEDFNLDVWRKDQLTKHRSDKVLQKLLKKAKEPRA